LVVVVQDTDLLELLV
jgi:hypothetical protein